MFADHTLDAFLGVQYSVSSIQYRPRNIDALISSHVNRRIAKVLINLRKHLIELQSAYAHYTYFMPEVPLESFFGLIQYLILQLKQRYFIDYFLGRNSYGNNRAIAYFLRYKM